MKARIRLFFPRTSMVLGAVLLYGLFATGIHLIFRKLIPQIDPSGPDFANLIKPMLSVPLIFWGALYGIYRGLAFHPVFNIRYLAWLANSPWRPGLALPAGAVHLVWQDVLQMVLLSALSLLVAHDHPAVPLIPLLAGYLLTSVAGLAYCRQFSTIGLIALLLPFSLIQSQDLWIRFAVAIVLYLITLIGLRQSWKTFPWNLHDRIAKGRRGRGPAPSLGWPFNCLNGFDPPRLPKLNLILPISVLAAWYVFLFLHVIAEPWARKPIPISNAILLAGSFIAFLRTVIYCSVGLPPIPIRARVALRQCIIPGYDKIFIAPFAVLAAAILGSLWLREAGVYPPLMAAIMTVTLLPMAFCLPPSLRSWQLTGHHRLVEKRT